MGLPERRLLAARQRLAELRAGRALALSPLVPCEGGPTRYGAAALASKRQRSPPIASSVGLRPRARLIALHPPRISKDGTHHEHPPARDEMRQVVRQALDVFAPLL